jgi:FdrA protein
MAVRLLLKRHTYYDSITLMSLTVAIEELPGVERVGAVMATAANCALLRDSALLPADWLAEQEMPPEASDLLIAVRAADEAQAEAALQVAEQRLTRHVEQAAATAGAIQPPARSLEKALQREQEANLAIVAVAGEHAWLEAEQALSHGLHVFLFSDNVPLAQEQRLKALASERGLLLMGPDCGTAIINGVGLGFSNVVPSGSIGIVGASGTGIQQLTCLIAATGLGISQALGTGGRDLSVEIGGVMMRRGLALLADDPQTEVIVLVSKPPAQHVAQAILEQARLDKPVVVVFLGAEQQQYLHLAPNISFASTLTEGAEQAIALAGGNARASRAFSFSPGYEQLAAIREQLAPSQRFVRALYAGGTLCDEAMIMFLQSGRIRAVASNIPLQPSWALAEGELYREHTALDLGDDEFTRGRPHPMIDPSTRLHYFTQAAQDPQTAVILLDVVLGFCAHSNPAAVYVPVITAARAQAEAEGRNLPIVISLCGTEGDPQRLSVQRAAFEAAGALVYESNAMAALATAQLVPIDVSE